MNILFAIIFFFLFSQVTQTFINDLHPWTTLLGVAAIGLCALDVAIRQGKGKKDNCKKLCIFDSCISVRMHITSIFI
jgi:hypothetical protein